GPRTLRRVSSQFSFDLRRRLESQDRAGRVVPRWAAAGRRSIPRGVRPTRRRSSVPARSVQRRRHKSLARLQNLSASERLTEAARRLVGWRREARSRAASLDAPPVWELAGTAHTRAVAAALDPAGGLQ